MTDPNPTSAPELAPRRSAPPLIFYIAPVIAGVFLVRLLGGGWSGKFPAVWPDAIGIPSRPNESYLAVAGKTPFRPSFYFAYRPIAYPAMLWAFARNSELVVLAQSLLYCGVVTALCVTAWRVLHSRVVAIITVVLIVGCAIQAKYAMWNTQILSESLAISLGFAAISAWWRFAIGPTRRRAQWAFAFTIAWMLVRDAQVLPATVVLVPAVVAIAWRATHLDRRLRRTLVVGTIAIVIAAAYSYEAEAVSHRALLSFHHVIGVRVLPDAELTNFFKHHGMPLDDALRSRTGKSGLEDDFYKETDPRFTKYFAWSKGEGRRALVLSMLIEFPHYRHMLYKDLPSILKGDVSYYDTYNIYNRLPQTMPAQLGGPTTRSGLVQWLLLACLALLATGVVAWRVRRSFGMVVFGVVGLVFTLFELYTTWVGDPIEMQRHMIGMLSRLSIVLIIVVATGFDAVLDAAAIPATTATHEHEPIEEPTNEDPAEEATVHA